MTLLLSQIEIKKEQLQFLESFRFYLRLLEQIMNLHIVYKPLMLLVVEIVAK